ncbi:hypothetical protein ABZ990_11715 [Streptomyces sp. NPDC046203]|uniref:hypothetical protein n=1 Tax=Streptomyces sp. NPDC046203 TaxID=3154602 RepID=UPI0033C6B3F1
MSGPDPDLQASDNALKMIAQGLDRAHGELKDLMPGQTAVTGRGFSQLSLTGIQVGHQGLAHQFETFCERWGWGVRDLMQRANTLAAAIGLTGGAVHEQEQYVKDTLKIVGNGINGNPHLSEDEAKKRSWDELLQPSFSDPDWSSRSLLAAKEHVDQTWQDTGYDLGESSLDQFTATGMIDPKTREEMDAKLRDKLNPSQGAIQQAQEPFWGDR